MFIFTSVYNLNKLYLLIVSNDYDDDVNIDAYAIQIGIVLKLLYSSLNEAKQCWKQMEIRSIGDACVASIMMSITTFPF